MATGGYRAGAGGGPTDFLEEWKAKREKMRAKLNPPPPPGPAGDPGPAPAAAAPAPAPSPSLAAPAAPAPAVAAPAAPAVPSPGPGPPEAAPAGGEPEERTGAGARSSGPSARKGKGQIEKRKLREKRRSTGVVHLPPAQCLDEYEDDDAGQKERKREDAITQQNTVQNEAATLDQGGSYLLPDSSRTLSSRYKSTTSGPEEDGPGRYSRIDRGGFHRYNRDGNSSGNPIPNSALEKKIEELEKEVVKERQENLRLVRIMQDKEETIGKLKEEIDLLNRDLDEIEDENEQLRQENKTLLKVVGQLTR
ncbi:PRKC apoptosis WT1 regulator protein [Tachyglossus aculeatus]|uniref:PRKC apoptosis WT1 regulator protein n=1 Tax=Tachyglossus aculeatus TaxID=9261 RepID=UPI0018F62AFB|nr:PRKC apoptosis WT1 regulator protein [Tachyglossus aculeatus]